MRTRPTRFLLVAALAALAFAPAAAAAAATPDPDALTPISVIPLANPAPVLGSDGRYHMVFELQALNVSSLPFTVRTVTIRAGGAGAAPGRALARWSGRAVADVLVSLRTHRAATRLDPGEGAVMHLTLSVASRGSIPAALIPQLSLANASRPLTGPNAVTEQLDPLRVARRAPAVLGPPLRGDRWLAADGCCTAARHVRATQPFGGGLHTVQRFAIDWERLDAQGRLFTGDKRRLTNWPGYGSDVLAVANGRIVHAIDGEPNQVPGETPVGITPATADGNGVILRLDDGRFVFYAHMIPGSLTVRRGERVRRGQVLGHVGNSGNSTAPHLHLHVADANAILGANGLPYVFGGFDVTGRVASTAAFDHAEATGDPVRTVPVRTGARTNALPLDQVIVTWP
jgi:murein DD-endopeptidase MepM/ murein hydrolase activator NlpD